MVDVNDIDDLAKLRNALEYSRRKLTPFMENRMDAIRQYVGKHYSDNGTSEKVPVNYIQQTISIYLRSLAARAPRAMISTPHANLKPYAVNIELAANYLFKQINLGRTLRRWVLDAMFCIGIIKVGVDVQGTVNINGTDHAVGQPFCDVIDLDDWVHDFTANDISRCEFMGNRYYVSRQDALDAGIYDEEVINQAPSQEYRQNNETGTTKASSISQGGSAQTGGELKQKIVLWDLWLPQEKKLVTLTENANSKPARVIDWTGPKDGPFHLLFFDEVPSNIMPLAPVANLMDLHDLANRIFLKIGRQAERQKTITYVKAGATADGKRTVAANDGDTIEVDDPKNVGVAKYGGVEAESMAFSVQLEQIYNRQAGNPFTLGGLGAMSKTVGQDQLLSENAGKSVVAMQEATVEATAKVAHDICYWIFTDPMINLPLSKEVEGVTVPVHVTSDMMQGEFLDYNFTIDPYSMQHSTPAMKLEQMLTILERAVIPFLPQMEQQGKFVDMDELIRSVAKYGDIQELLNIITSVNGPVMPDANVVGQPRKPPVTTRNYVRTNRSGGMTIPGQAQVLQQSLLGNKSQPSQINSMMTEGAA